MTINRFLLIVAFSAASGFLSAVMGADTGPLHRFRVEPARVRQLIQVIQVDPDENKRKAALVELGHADPRLMTEVIQSVTDALLKDPSPAVRLTAVEVISQFKIVFPYSGIALESTIESDKSEVVRTAAKQALWEYHLMGYKSAKGGDGLPPQTAEPPLARPARVAVPVTSEPPVIPVLAEVRPPTYTQLPPVGELPGPRVFNLPNSLGQLSNSRSVHPPLTATIEPPRATSRKMTLPPSVQEPPILPQWPERFRVGTTPPFAFDLPSIVTPPGPIPGFIPYPESPPALPEPKTLRK